jgi:ribonuclease T1
VDLHGRPLGGALSRPRALSILAALAGLRVVALAALALGACGPAAPAWDGASSQAIQSQSPSDPLAALPADERPEVRATVERIAAGGPFPHRRDGIVFANREGRLPPAPPGAYHEYTVETPGAADRGARRIVAGRDGRLYYSNDHYRTFVPIGRVGNGGPG